VKVLVPIDTGIGNAVLMTPMLRTLLKRVPDAQVTLVGANRFGANELFQFDPSFHQILKEWDGKTYDFRLEPFLGGNFKETLQLRMQGKYRRVIAHKASRAEGYREKIRLTLARVLGFEFVPFEGLHESKAYLNLLRPLGIQEDQFESQPVLDPNLVSCGVKEARSFGLPADTIVVQVGASNQKPTPKKWPAQHWRELVKSLRKDCTVVLVGDATEVTLANEIAAEGSGVINLAGKTSLTGLVGVLNHASVVVGVDSGICHLASALGRPTLVLWGPTAFARTHPVGPKTQFAKLELQCAPCTGLPGLRTEKEALEFCKFDNRCMKELTPVDVSSRLRLMRETR
jgi:ADP-heptose:LPS heptosyltransferase